MKTKIEIIGGDWKDTDGINDQFIDFLGKIGYFVYNDPSTEGYDYISFVITKTKLTKSKLRDLVAQNMGCKNWKDYLKQLN